MSGYGDRSAYPEHGDVYWGDQAPQSTYNFDTTGNNFGQELNFQSFDASQSSEASYAGSSLYGANPYLDPAGVGSGYHGDIFTPSAPSADQPGFGNGGTSTEFEDEPPLLEELGINPDHIIQKTLAVLNPFRTTDASILQDTDLAGPLVFCLALGAFLLLSGKVHFSYIYGIGVMGCLAIYALLSLMAVSGVTLGTVVSVLGYCLLPMVMLSGINVVFSLQGLIGFVLTGLAIAWCSLSASKLFVTALFMDHQQPLVAYPCALLYGVFALITIF